MHPPLQRKRDMIEMITIAIRGATTIENNTKKEILEASKELLESIIKENSINIDEIISILFTATKDISKAYPAVAARELGITQAALMCMQEMYVEESLPMCIRVMVEIQRNPIHKKDLTGCHVYLRGAKKLRPDLVTRHSIAIDGPSGAGKSTIARQVANILGCIYIDTGAMYRAVAYYCKEKGVDWHDQLQVLAILDDIDMNIQIKDGVQHIYLNGVDISQAIRTQAIAAGASAVASYDPVRRKLVDLQRQMALGHSVVMDGRDIGTHVLKDASVKIYLTASVSERAKRRVNELKQRGEKPQLDAIKQEIIERDANDTNREFSPLRKAKDAIEIDTTGKDIEQVTNEIITIIKN